MAAASYSSLRIVIGTGHVVWLFETGQAPLDSFGEENGCSFLSSLVIIKTIFLNDVLVCRYNLKILKLALPNNVGDTAFCEYEMRSS
ncbi:hypothetical protein KC19_4G024500 [Ceratodon purpureus]|uniref:Uncharacterized protein n=1 Tax=Ceratodon purpureus TaxID=3225 RepID=A0A8T0I7J2_CERPU|nr:hypothetical protein KC19_4G024100 [Ceratodon purpureus]KAG0578458.1 hypothetical protein KC19_4G024500 [Ceratodon purpureus]